MRWPMPCSKTTRGRPLVAKSNSVVGHFGRSVCLPMSLPHPYPNSHHQHKCMSLLYYVVLVLFSTAPLLGKGQLLSNYFSQNSKFSPCCLESGRPTSNWYPLQPVLLTRSVTHAVLCDLKSRRQRSISEVPSARPRWRTALRQCSVRWR